MKNRFMKASAMILALVMSLTMFTACGSESNEDVPIDQIVDAAVQAALEAAVVPTTVTIEADGQQITIEDTEGKSMQQLLDQASITLHEGDILSLASSQTLTGNIAIQVLRRHTVLIDAFGTQYTVSLMGGNVADALALIGVTLEDNHAMNVALDAALEEGMEIILTEKEEEVPETEPEVTEPETSKNDSSSPSKKPSSTKPSSTKPTEPKPTEPKPTEPKPTEPKPTTPAKTIVSEETYLDCDGSGHGVKVITYSDGSQEEVPF